VAVPVTRTGTNLAGGILIDYTITGNTEATLSALSGTLSFAAAALAPAPPLQLTIVNNPAAQLDRTLVVTLSNPRSSNGFAGANSPVIGAIGNTSVKINDTLPRVQFSAPVYNVVEGDAAQITITRTGATPASVTVQFTTTDGTALAGTDYTGSSVTLTVTGTGKTVTIPTVNDLVLSGTKTVILTLTGTGTASVGTPNVATLNILDRQSAGTLQFAGPVASVMEGSTARVTVTRSGSNLVGNVSVNWMATGGSATADVDFTPSSGTLTFGPGVASQTFDIAALEDTDAEGTETILLGLASPTGGATLGGLTSTTIFIIDKQQTVGFAGNVSVSEKVTPATVQIVRSGIPSGSLTVTATTVDGTALAGQDYRFKSVPVTFEAGEIAKAFPVDIITTNASARNGNRKFSVALSGASVIQGASNVSTVTILDGKPDLVITSVSAPSSTLTGKAVSTPSTVRNMGSEAVTTPFSVVLYLVRAADFDANDLTKGSAVANQSVASLAAGATAIFSTQITLNDEFPAGDYYLSAVAEYNKPEADSGNNGRSSAPAVISVQKNLTKFKSASAAFSQTDLPSGPFPWFASTPPLSCDVTGSVNLTGTFAITNQQGGSATGQATLTGTLDDEPVQYVLLFTGTGDDNGNVSAVVNSVTFRSLTRALTGSGNGSLTGTLDGRVLSANVSGQFITSTGGGCLFTGSLQALAQTSYQLLVGAGSDVSSFAFDTSPIPLQVPVGPEGAGAEFRVFFDSNFPQPKDVIFTGPPGSGITSKPAEDKDSHVDDGGVEARYRVGRDGASGFPGGKWSVLYKGQTRTYTLPPFNANASFVVVWPSVTVDPGGLLTRVDWVYRNRITGANLSAAPPFISGIGIRIQVNDQLGREPESNFLSPSTTAFDLAAAGFTPPEWTRVRGIKFQYADLAGNIIEQNYGKAFSVRVQPALENAYGNFSPDPLNGFLFRQLNVFADVPELTVDKALCPDPVTGLPRGPGGQSGPPFFVQIQNLSAGTGLPFDTPLCLEGNGQTSFEDNGVLTDIFSQPYDLDGHGFTSPIPVGTPFRVDIRTLTMGNVSVTTTVQAPEPDPAVDRIRIPGAAGFKPSGIHLSDAKLGQNQTISWTKPAFPVRDLYVSASVYTSSTGPGLFCSSPQPNISLDATQATIKFLTSCFGQGVQQANFCIVYTGEQGQESRACWNFAQ